LGLLVAGLLLLSGRGNAGDDAAKYRKDVQAIADALKQGKMDAATDLAKKLAVKEKDDGVGNVMALMKPRGGKDNGFGVGKNPGDINPDGIELKLNALGRDLISPAKMKKESEALEEMALRMHAIAQFADALPPAKDKGKLTKKKWLEFSKGMLDSVVDLEKSIQTGSPNELKKAVTKVNANCNQCHSIFKN